MDLSSDVYERLRATANQQGKPIEMVAQEWLAERSTLARTDLPPPAPPGERDRLTEARRDCWLSPSSEML